MSELSQNIPDHEIITNEKWYKEWRTVAAYTYLVICLYDFMLAPIFSQVFAYWTHTVYVMWTPLTTQGGGLFHISFGAIIGVSAWGKFSENQAIIRNMPDYSSYNNYEPPYNPQQPRVINYTDQQSPVANTNPPNNLPHHHIPLQ